MTQRIQSFIAFVLAGIIITTGIALFRSCQVPRIVIPATPSIAIATPAPSPSPQLQAASKTTSTAAGTGTQKTKVTLWLPSPENAKKPTSQEAQEGVLTAVPGTSGPAGNWGKIEIELEQEISTAATSSGEASASIAPNCLQNVESSIGIIAGTMPGIIALDWRAIHLGPLGLDLAANHRSVSAGISAGGKIFGLAGGYQAFDGGRGIFAAGGVRF